MNKIKLGLIAALLIGFSACDSTQESETKENTEQTQGTTEEKEVVKEIVRDNRTPNGSYFKAEIAGVEKIFDLTGNSMKANHYEYRPDNNYNMLRMVRFTSTEQERISIQISGLLLDAELPLNIPNDSLGVQMKFSYYYKSADGKKVKEVLKPANDFTFTITEIKGDSLIGTFEGFFVDGAITNNNYQKVENGIFRFKLEGITPPM